MSVGLEKDSARRESLLGAYNVCLHSVIRSSRDETSCSAVRRFPFKAKYVTRYSKCENHFSVLPKTSQNDFN